MSEIPFKTTHDGRPKKLVCFVERDEEYFDELTKLDGAVIMYNPNLESDLTLEEVATYASQTNLVSPGDISVGVLTRSRYVIMLPHGLSPEVFIKAIPLDVWKQGFSFYQWCPLDDAVMAVPHYKVLLDLVGIPLDLYRQKEVIRAISGIGTFLGTIDQDKQGVIATWSVVVATTDLARIPDKISYMVGGREVPVDVIARTWKHCPLYNVADMAQPKEKFNPTLSLQEPPSAIAKDSPLNDQEKVSISRSVLQYMCQGRSLESMPEEVRAALTATNCTESTRKQSDEIINNSVEVVCMATPMAPSQDQTARVPSMEIVVPQNSGEAGLRSSSRDPEGDCNFTSPHEILAGISNTNHTINPRGPLPCDSGNNSYGRECSLKSPMEGNPPRILQRGKKIIQELKRGSKGRKLSSKNGPMISPRALRPSTRQKRKQQEQARENARRPKNASKQARLKKNEDGLIEVLVTYEHCSNIATGSGFNVKQVQEALIEDNLFRNSTKPLHPVQNTVKVRVMASEENSGASLAALPETAVGADFQKNGAGEMEREEDIGSATLAVLGSASLADLTKKTVVADPHLLEQHETDWNQGEHLTDFDPDSDDELDDLGSDFD